MNRLTLGALLVCASGIAAAHGGGLDKYGCHNDRKHGGYHCHRGPLAGKGFASKQEMLKALDTQKEKPAPTGRR
jgi:hypothetical protein